MIVCDFEKGLVNACNSVFTDSEMAGCAFHFGQCNWRKIQALGLVQEYQNKRPIYEAYHSCLNLSFYPENKVPAAFGSIKTKYLTSRASSGIKNFF